MRTDAPLFDALCSLADREGVRFHMPGHKGRGEAGPLEPVFRIDYTEIPATGNLYGESGVIQQAEALAARYYGMDGCYFLTCGATQGIQAAIAAFCSAGSPLVVDRNCHISVFDACVLLDLDPFYAVPEFLPHWGVTGEIRPDVLDRALADSGAKAAILTCPTYYGGLMNLDALAETAHRRDAALIVDAAHGAHLKACGIDLFSAADAVILSAHKTLHALGQGAYLLFRDRGREFAHRLRRSTALFGTTSPSYPVMASLDLARARLEAKGYGDAAALCRKAAEDIEASTPFRVYPSGDPCRLVVNTAFGGITGHEAAAFLRERDIEVEMSDQGSIVCIVTAADTAADLDRLTAALNAAGGKPSSPRPSSPPPLPKKILSPRQAYFGKPQPFTLAGSIGRIAAQSVAPYPPGVPVVTFGEEIDKISVEYLLEKGYNELDTILCLSNVPE